MTMPQTATIEGRLRRTDPTILQQCGPSRGERR
jgi:hypothetical protein